MFGFGNKNKEKDASSKPQLKSTQSYLSIDEIKEGTLVRGHTFCAVIAVSSTNFALKSQEEQNALIFGYQGFLNALDFPVQILMQSRKLDIHSYLEKVRLKMEQQTNELLRVQTGEYIEFINKLIENASIMNKTFYIIVPHASSPLGAASKGVFGAFKKNQGAQTAGAVASFREDRLKLDQKVNTVIAGLGGMGLKAAVLDTPDIVELMYNSYNFDAGPMLDTEKLDQFQLNTDGGKQ